MGEAARDAIPALARNADKVDGIHASRTPRAGHLVPLGKSRKFPKSVLPQAPPGPVGPKGEQGERGEKGEKGDKGDPGAQGVPGVGGRVRVSATTPLTSDNLQSHTVSCPAGTRVLGGGGIVPAAAPVALYASRPVESPPGWFVAARETVAYGGSWNIVVDAVCARAEP